MMTAYVILTHYILDFVILHTLYLLVIVHVRRRSSTRTKNIYGYVFAAFRAEVGKRARKVPMNDSAEQLSSNLIAKIQRNTIQKSSKVIRGVANDLADTVLGSFGPYLDSFGLPAGRATRIQFRSQVA